MIPAVLIRKIIEWVRHNEKLANSNPYTRCVEAIKVFDQVYQEQYGEYNADLIELAVIASYWLEFFHCPNPSTDESQWREGLVKKASGYDDFNAWQEWFLTNYAKVYQQNNIWSGLIASSWAFTHQNELSYSNDSWNIVESTSYLPTSEFWRLEPHVNVIQKLLNAIWTRQIYKFEQLGFYCKESPKDYLGKVSSLGFDIRDITLNFQIGSIKEPIKVPLDRLIPEIIAPVADDGYRRLDNNIFIENFFDYSAFKTKANYYFDSLFRYCQLIYEKTPDLALLQLSAEGWLVSELLSK